MGISLFLAAAAAAAAPAAPAAPSGIAADARCVLLSNAFARQEKDPMRRQMAAISATYYLGRIDSRVSAPQMRSLLMTQKSLLRDATAGAEMTACANRLQQQMIAVSKAMPAAPQPPARPGAPAAKK